MLKIATWNVNSIAARLPIALKWLGDMSLQARPEVVCLQEIKCVDEKFPAAAFEELGYNAVVFGQPTYNGLATLVKHELVPGLRLLQKNFPDDPPDAQRRLLDVEVAGVRVINIYLPNGQAVGSAKYAYKLEWMERLRRYLDEDCDPAQPLALLGDFNVAPAPLDVYDPAFWEGRILFSQPEKAALQRLQDWGLADSFRRLYPQEQSFSWWDYRQAGYRRNLGLRIDHILVTAPLLAACREVLIDKEPRGWERPSDHTPVIAAFEL